MTPVLPDAMQHPTELRLLVELYRKRQPMHTLEVGVGQGGTLYHWLLYAPTGATVVAIDDHHDNARAYQDWERDDVDFLDLWGDCADPQVVEQARSDAPYDWVFIDADHHDAAVRRDWMNYAPMCAPDGLVILHDIAPTDDPTVEVEHLWRELADTLDTEEVMAHGGFGIGIVHVPPEQVST